jgi:hypothetical protein
MVDLRGQVVLAARIEIAAHHWHRPNVTEAQQMSQLGQSRRFDGGQPLPVHADQRTFAGYVGTSNVPKAYRNIRVADRESRRLEVGAAITEPRPKPIRQGLLDALRLL